MSKKTKKVEEKTEKTLSETLTPRSGDYLVVIDMQNDFITGSLGSEDSQKILPNVVRLIELFHEKTSRPSTPDNIIYTLDTHSQNYLDTFEGRRLPIRHCINGTAGHCLPDELVKLMFDYRATPMMKSTFGTLEFGNSIDTCINHGAGKDATIYICGLCTNICVVSNALILRAKFPNNRIVCVEDCCAASGLSYEARETNHRSAIDVMSSCQIDIATLDEIK